MILHDPAMIAAYTQRGWWGDLTIHALFDQTVAQGSPDDPCLVDPPNRQSFTDGPPARLTWAEVGRLVDRMAALLHRLGFRKDDMLCVQLPTTHEVFVAYLAALRLGVIPSPVPFQYREHELSHILDRIRPRGFLTCRRIGKHDHARMALDLARTRPFLQHVLAFGDDVPADAVDVGRSLGDAIGDGREIDPALARAEVNANEIAFVLWTSGTESTPKPVPRSHNNVLASRRLMTESADLRTGCRMLAPRLMNTVGGLSGALMPWLDRRGVLCLHQPFDAAVYLEQLRTERIEFTSTPPAILGGLLRDEKIDKARDLPMLRAVSSGSAALPEHVVRGFRERFGVEILNFYGSTEGASLAAVPAEIPDDADRARYFPRYGASHLSWRISIATGIETRLIDRETGAAIDEPGRIGELAFRGSNVFPGYLDEPELNARTFDPEGFYRTGDLFEIAGPDGRYFRFVGRAKDIIVRGGLNISALELEGVLGEHPDVAEVAIFGAPDERLGEIVCAAIVRRPGTAPTLERLAAWLRDERRLAIFKLPQRLLDLEALPRSPAGKVLKSELRALLGRQ